MGIPFEEINEILSKTNFDNILYYKLKNLLTYFISGKNIHKSKLSKVISDFKIKVTETPFKDENNKAFQSHNIDNSLQLIEPKFQKLLDITYELLTLQPTGDIEIFYKTHLKKYIGGKIKIFNDSLLTIFDIDHRIMRNKYKLQLAEIDKKIKKQKGDNINGMSDQEIAANIKTLIGENINIGNNVLSGLGFTFQTKKGGDSEYDKKYLVGYLSVGINYEINYKKKTLTVKKEPTLNDEDDDTDKAARVADTASAAAVAAEAKRAAEPAHDLAVVAEEAAKRSPQIGKAKALEFFTIVYYVTVNIEYIRENQSMCSDLITQITTILENTDSSIPIPSPEENNDSNLLKACYNGVVYFEKLINDSDLTPENKTAESLKNFVINTGFKKDTGNGHIYISYELKNIIDLDFMDKYSKNFDETRINEIFTDIKQSSYTESTDDYVKDFIMTFQRDDTLNDLNFTTQILKSFLVRTIIVFFHNYLLRKETADISNILSNLQKYENEIYFNTTHKKSQTYYKNMLNYMIFLKTNLENCNEASTENNITAGHYVYLFKQRDVNIYLNNINIILSPILISDNLGYLFNTPQDKKLKDLHTYLDNISNGKNYEIKDAYIKSNITEIRSKKLVILLEQYGYQKEQYIFNYEKMSKIIKNTIFHNIRISFQEYKNLEKTYIETLDNIRNINLLINAKMLFSLCIYFNFTVPKKSEPVKYTFFYQTIRDIIENTQYFDIQNTDCIIKLSNFIDDRETNSTYLLNELLVSFYKYYSEHIWGSIIPATLYNIQNAINDLQNKIIAFEAKQSIEEFLKQPLVTVSVTTRSEAAAKAGGNRNLNNLIIQDRIYFVLLLFIIRTISTFFINVYGYHIKTISQRALLYFTIYVISLLLFVILANSNIAGVKEVFYYLNINTEDGRGLLRIILQLTCICSLIPIPYIIKDKKEFNDITLYIFILASIVALIV